MRQHVRHILTFFIKTFFLINFVVGTLMYIFIPGRISPVPEPSTMLFIAVIIAIPALVEVFRGRYEKLT